MTEHSVVLLGYSKGQFSIEWIHNNNNNKEDALKKIQMPRHASQKLFTLS